MSQRRRRTCQKMDGGTAWQDGSTETVSSSIRARTLARIPPAAPLLPWQECGLRRIYPAASSSTHAMPCCSCCPCCPGRAELQRWRSLRTEGGGLPGEAIAHVLSGGARSGQHSPRDVISSLLLKGRRCGGHRLCAQGGSECGGALKPAQARRLHPPKLASPWAVLVPSRGGAGLRSHLLNACMSSPGTAPPLLCCASYLGEARGLQGWSRLAGACTQCTQTWGGAMPRGLGEGPSTPPEE